jgi:hemolysin III
MPASHSRIFILEERLNALTHGIGAGLSVTALVLLLATCRGCDAIRIVSYAVYGSSLIILYLSSTLYHGVMEEKLKEILGRIDHSAIYLLIAGTYTPFTLITLNGPWGWTIFGIEWGLAIAGVIYKVFFYTDKHRGVSTALYLAMGWLAIIAIQPLFATLPSGGLIWLGIGGLSYSLGVVFYLWDRLPFAHVVWHLFVMGGSISHFFAVFFYV